MSVGGTLTSCGCASTLAGDVELLLGLYSCVWCVHLWECELPLILSELPNGRQRQPVVTTVSDSIKHTYSRYFREFDCCTYTHTHILEGRGGGGGGGGDIWQL